MAFWLCKFMQMFQIKLFLDETMEKKAKKAMPLTEFIIV